MTENEGGCQAANSNGILKNIIGIPAQAASALFEKIGGALFGPTETAPAPRTNRRGRDRSAAEASGTDADRQAALDFLGPGAADALSAKTDPGRNENAERQSLLDFLGS